MADYNLGKAHGSIEIDYDSRGTRQASQDLDKLGKTAEQSAKRTHVATEQQTSDHEQLAEAARKLAGDVSRLAVAEIAAKARLQAAEQELARTRAQGAGAADRLRGAERELTAAQERAIAAGQRLRQSETALMNVRQRLGRIPPLRADVEVNRGQFNQLIEMLRGVDINTRKSVGILNTFRSRLGIIIALSSLAAPTIAGLAVSLLSLAGAAGVAVGALAALGAVGGTIATAFSGVSEVFKAANKQAASAGSSAGAAASQQRAAARSIEQAIRGVRDAQEALIRTQQDAVRAARDASRQIVAAERGLRDAQIDSIRAQESLNRARRDAARQLDDLRAALLGGALDERQAILDVEKAQLDLNATLADPRSSDLDRRQATLTLERQQHQLEQIRLANQRLGVDQGEAAAKGVKGAESVVDAQLSVLHTQEQLEQAQFDLGDAVATAARQQIDAQLDVRNAVEAVADAHRDLEEAYLSAADVGGGAASAVADAMANVSPEVREFVNAVLAQRDAWREVKFAVQDALFDDLAESVAPLAEKYFPLLKQGMSGIATELNAIVKDLVDFLISADATRDVQAIFESTRLTVRALAPAVRDLVEIFFDLATVASSLLPEMSDGFSNMTNRLKETVQADRESGALEQWMRQAIATVQELGRVLRNIGSIIGTVLTTFDQAGGGLLNNLEMVTREFDEFLKSAEGQQILRALAQTLSAVASALTQVLVGGLRALAPAFVQLAPLIQQFASILADQIVVTLKILSPILTVVFAVLNALGPVLVPLIASMVLLNKVLVIAAAVWRVLNIVMRANPFLLIVAAVIALATLIIMHWEEIKTFLLAAWEAIKTAAGVVWEGIKQQIIDPIKEAFDWVVNKITEFGNWLKDQWDFIKEVTRRAIEIMKRSIIDPIKDAIDGVVNFFRNLPGNIRDALGDLGNLLWNAGRDLILGLWRGIESLFNWVWDRIQDLGNLVSDAFSAALSIFSPSQVFMKFGEFTIQGYIIGLEAMEGAAVNRVMEIAASISDAGQPPPIVPSGTFPTPRGDDGAELDPRQIVVENLTLNVTGNLDPTNPTQWRRAITGIRDGIRTVEREER